MKIGTDIYSSEKRSLIMSSVRSRGTKPELLVRTELRKMGFGYRLNRKDLPGTPDIVISRKKLAVFVHGCFWHGHACAKGQKLPKQNSEFWREKIDKNKVRDFERLERLSQCGWNSLVIWECETKNRENLSAILTMELLK